MVATLMMIKDLRAEANQCEQFGRAFYPRLPDIFFSVERVAAALRAACSTLWAWTRVDVHRELRVLAERGRTGSDAWRDAVALTRAKSATAPLLAELQTKTDRCLICDGAEDGERPFIAVLSGHPERPHWLHARCHTEHVQRKTAKVDATMRAAGFGDEHERDARSTRIPAEITGAAEAARGA